MEDSDTGLLERALRAYVRRRMVREGHAGALVWVDPEGEVVVLGQAGVADLEGLAWAVDQSYRWAGRGLLGDRRRVTGVRQMVGGWVARARAHARGQIKA